MPGYRETSNSVRVHPPPPPPHLHTGAINSTLDSKRKSLNAAAPSVNEANSYKEKKTTSLKSASIETKTVAVTVSQWPYRGGPLQKKRAKERHGRAEGRG